MAAHARYLSAPTYLGDHMKTSVKLKGILAVAGLTYEEFGKLCGLTRQTIHAYLNTGIDIEDLDNGVKAIKVADELVKLVGQGVLPLSRAVTKKDKVERIKEMLTI